MEIVDQQDHCSLILEHDFADSKDYCSKNVPEELKNYDQWVCWKIEVKEDRLTKVPINVLTGENAKTNNPKTWASFNQAIDYFKKHQNQGIAGIGFVFSEKDSFTGIDLDKCRNPETEEIDLGQLILLKKWTHTLK